MKLQPVEYSLRDDIHITLRSAESNDAEDFIKFLKELSLDTHFFELESDEIDKNMTDIGNKFIKYMMDSNAILMLIIHDGDIIGYSSIEPVAYRAKLKHRAIIKSALLSHFLGYGIAGLSISNTLKLADDMDFEQYEIELFADNRRLVEMFSEMGFEEWGRVKRAYKIDSDYIDKLIMGKTIRNN